MSLVTKIHGIKSLMQFDNKLQLLLARTLFQKNPVVIYCLRGKQILVDHSSGDENGTRDAITSPMYKQFLVKMKLLEQVNVLDFGANGGGFPLMLELNGVSIQKVACIEFNPNTYSRLRFNMERNVQAEFVGFNVAVCGEKQEFDVALGSGGTGDTLYQDNEEQNGREKRHFKIPGLTFDDIYAAAFGEERVDICKIDVEGAEYDIFATPSHECLRRCTYLIMEIHSHSTKEKGFVVDELTRLGFEEISRDAAVHPDVYLFQNTDAVAG